MLLRPTWRWWSLFPTRANVTSNVTSNACLLRKIHHAPVSGPPAHLVYDPSQLPDTATLLLVAKSAASSDFKDQTFWQSCSLQARKLCAQGAQDAHLLSLARYTLAAATVNHQDTELMKLGAVLSGKVLCQFFAKQFTFGVLLSCLVSTSGADSELVPHFVSLLVSVLGH
eukprot:Skav200795  [mRNA]  locus=scaffold370:99337:99846:+ [translate_table: standard]